MARQVLGADIRTGSARESERGSQQRACSHRTQPRSHAARAREERRGNRGVRRARTKARQQHENDKVRGWSAGPVGVGCLDQRPPKRSSSVCASRSSAAAATASPLSPLSLTRTRLLPTASTASRTPRAARAPSSSSLSTPSPSPSRRARARLASRARVCLDSAVRLEGS